MKLHNAGVLWLSGATFGWTLPDILSVMHIYNPTSWSIVALEMTFAVLTGVLAFHPITGGENAKEQH